VLIQLEIKNIALIDEISIELGEGLNILTGETGAGKSIIIDSINAVLGGRFSAKDIIKSGKEQASVTAVFSVEYERLSDLLDESGIEPQEDSCLIISREFNLSGKNICRINGRIVPVSLLKQVGERIIDIHGQHENQSLLNPQNHIELLDSFGSGRIFPLKQKYIKLLSEYRELTGRLKKLTENQRERETRIDLLRYQVSEIKNAQLKPGEDQELESRRTILANSEKINSSLTKAYGLLYGGDISYSTAFDNIGKALAHLNEICGIDESFQSLCSRIEDITYQLQDICHEIRMTSESVEYNPELLGETEERLDLVNRLKRKYGKTIEDILEYCSKAEAELDELEHCEENSARILDELKKIDAELFEIARHISKEREKAAAQMEKLIMRELEDLEMKNTRFKVNIEFEGSKDEEGGRKYLNNGMDTVEFLISPNPGEPLKPLSKIASGGEMSRIMLAIKNVLANIDRIPILIFDEIDSGISGRVAQKVGEKLLRISRSHQVICVTHLAQIASMADNHYQIEKNTTGCKTFTTVKKLEGDSVKLEIARMLGGTNISEISLKHAEEMLHYSLSLK